jgi:hypothetical protein
VGYLMRLSSLFELITLENLNSTKVVVQSQLFVATSMTSIPSRVQTYEVSSKDPSTFFVFPNS